MWNPYSGDTRLFVKGLATAHINRSTLQTRLCDPHVHVVWWGPELLPRRLIYRGSPKSLHHAGVYLKNLPKGRQFGFAQARSKQIFHTTVARVPGTLPGAPLNRLTTTARSLRDMRASTYMESQAAQTNRPEARSLPDSR